MCSHPVCTVIFLYDCSLFYLHVYSFRSSNQRQRQSLVILTNTNSKAAEYLSHLGAFCYLFCLFVLHIVVNYLCTVLHIYFKLYKYARWQ